MEGWLLSQHSDRGVILLVVHALLVEGGKVSGLMHVQAAAHVAAAAALMGSGRGQYTASGARACSAGRGSSPPQTWVRPWREQR